MLLLQGFLTNQWWIYEYMIPSFKSIVNNKNNQTAANYICLQYRRKENNFTDLNHRCFKVPALFIHI